MKDQSITTKQMYFDPLLDFSEWFSDTVRRRHINMKKLSEKVGISYNTICNYKQGRCEPNLLNAVSILMCLGCEINIKCDPANIPKSLRK